MKEVKYYDKEFYAEQQDGSYQAAKNILPIIQNFFHPKSVLDIGCGVGYWLKVWKEELGVDDILGIEGPYIGKELFRIDKKYLKTTDLKQPLDLDRRFDLVTSLEVAEHIPENCADTFISSLVNASDIVLFSAAIIGQIGTYHINEQMPEYWAKKFLVHDYIPVDCVRPLIWGNDRIAYWYRQNMIVFIKRERISDFPELLTIAENTNPEFLIRIHPEKYFSYVKENHQLQTFLGFIKYKLYKLKMWIKQKK